MMGKMGLAAFAAIAVSLASASAEEEAGADQRIGAEVDRICFARTIDGWRAPKGFDSAVLLQKSVNNWYLVEVSGACRQSDFRFAETIGIDSRPAGGCVTRGDVIIVRGAGNIINRCFITQINEWDDDAPAPGEEEEAEDEGGES